MAFMASVAFLVADYCTLLAALALMMIIHSSLSPPIFVNISCCIITASAILFFTEYYMLMNAMRLVIGPKSVRNGWTTFNEADFGRVDTVVPVPGRKDQLYVFFGGRYLKIKPDDNRNDTFVNRGAYSIPSGWKSLEKAGFDTVDAALVVPGTSNQLYIFRRLKYVRMDNSTDEIIKGLSPISDGWSSLVEAGFHGVDGGGLYYVFRGDKYARIKVDSSRKDTLSLSARLFLGKFSLCIYPVFLRSLLHSPKVLDNPDEATEIQQRYA